MIYIAAPLYVLAFTAAGYVVTGAFWVLVGAWL
jgi:hypothetical protein